VSEEKLKPNQDSVKLPAYILIGAVKPIYIEVAKEIAAVA
jgi:hypothetical protein